MAKRISAGESCIELTKEQNVQIGILDSIIIVKDRQISLLKQENRNSIEIYQNQEKVSAMLKKDLETCFKSQNRNKLLLKLSVAGMIICAMVAILK